MSKEADEIKGLYFPCLDHGFVSLVDYMGDDAAIVQAARVSYGAGTKKLNEDRGLIRYLMRHVHTTPFEMVEFKFHVKLPIFVARQLVRHRTACLAGDVRLHFDLPNGIERRGNQLYKLSVKEVFEKFSKDERIGGMYLRCVNEETNSVQHTHIVDIWESGKKRVYRVELEDGSSATMSEDHMCLTESGWRRLKDAVSELPTVYGAVQARGGSVGFLSVGPGRATAVVPQFNPIDEATEEWRPIIGWEQYYEISSQGRVKRITGGKGSRSFGRCKKITVSGSHAVVPLNRPGVQVVEQVHQLMLEAFVGPAPSGYVCRHEDGNGLNNRLENLSWSTQQKNADDRVRDGATTGLRTNVSKVASITFVGEEMTYDLEVAGPWHNFSAGGMVVHNSLNEYSLRYSLPAMLFYVPEYENVGTQSKKNRQGRGDLLDKGHFNRAALKWNRLQEEAQELYEALINPDVDMARELARMHLPLNLYTEWYWKMDLHNLFHFLGLRCDSHAQWEIRQVAALKAAMVKRVVPTAFEAWVDYRHKSATFSRQDMLILQRLLGESRDKGRRTLACNGAADLVSEDLMKDDDYGLSTREVTELLGKFNADYSVPDFELDLSQAKPPEYFYKKAEEAVPKIPVRKDLGKVAPKAEK